MFHAVISLFQRISYPFETEGDANARGLVSSISGTIWSMCFISRDLRQSCKEHNPVIAILLNRYGNCTTLHREFAVPFSLVENIRNIKVSLNYTVGN